MRRSAYRGVSAVRRPEGRAQRKLGRLFSALLLTLAAMGFAGVAAAADAQVEAVQRRLVELGYDAGVADGLMGPRTRTAIRALQRDRGLPVSGRIDAGTLEALGLPPTPRVSNAADNAPAPAAGAPKSTFYGSEIPYERIGWAGPESAETVRERFQTSRDAPLRARINEILIVPNPERVYILAPGERLEELSCDPGAGRVHAELMLYPGGPVLFTPLNEGGLCQLGLGIVLGAGTTLMLEQTTWDELSSPGGRVRVGATGLEFQ